MFIATCRWCDAQLEALESCEHIHLGHDGQVYLVQGSHNMERDTYTEVITIPDADTVDDGTSAEIE